MVNTCEFMELDFHGTQFNWSNIRDGDGIIQQHISIMVFAMRTRGILLNLQLFSISLELDRITTYCYSLCLNQSPLYLLRIPLRAHGENLWQHDEECVASLLSHIGVESSWSLPNEKNSYRKMTFDGASLEHFTSGRNHSQRTT
ncbi:hypothetical protein M9H77_03800 [Catharanthus roseus]|uniref:Uncharacterized protein n=1 Tax=Catharanthus roseus TaxID=4058 RepID=A0ACC0CCJ4_CATRO|nr:hypothetical protein M9H77_03800 [Catharanthus roseus]